MLTVRRSSKQAEPVKCKGRFCKSYKELQKLVGDDDDVEDLIRKGWQLAHKRHPDPADDLKLRQDIFVTLSSGETYKLTGREGSNEAVGKHFFRNESRSYAQVKPAPSVSTAAATATTPAAEPLPRVSPMSPLGQAATNTDGDSTRMGMGKRSNDEQEEVSVQSQKKGKFPITASATPGGTGAELKGTLDHSSDGAKGTFELTSTTVISTPTGSQNPRRARINTKKLMESVSSLVQTHMAAKRGKEQPSLMSASQTTLLMQKQTRTPRTADTKDVVLFTYRLSKKSATNALNAMKKIVRDTALMEELSTNAEGFLPAFVFTGVPGFDQKMFCFLIRRFTVGLSTRFEIAEASNDAHAISGMVDMGRFVEHILSNNIITIAPEYHNHQLMYNACSQELCAEGGARFILTTMTGKGRKNPTGPTEPTVDALQVVYIDPSKLNVVVDASEFMKEDQCHTKMILDFNNRRATNKATQQRHTC